MENFDAVGGVHPTAAAHRCVRHVPRCDVRRDVGGSEGLLADRQQFINTVASKLVCARPLLQPTTLVRRPAGARARHSIARLGVVQAPAAGKN
jgi:hypothetical protein